MKVERLELKNHYGNFLFKVTSMYHGDWVTNTAVLSQDQLKQVKEWVDSQIEG